MDFMRLEISCRDDPRAFLHGFRFATTLPVLGVSSGVLKFDSLGYGENHMFDPWPMQTDGFSNGAKQNSQVEKAFAIFFLPDIKTSRLPHLKKILIHVLNPYSPRYRTKLKELRLCFIKWENVDEMAKYFCSSQWPSLEAETR